MIKLGIIITILAVIFILAFKIIILLCRYDRDESDRPDPDRIEGPGTRSVNPGPSSFR